MKTLISFRGVPVIALNENPETPKLLQILNNEYMKGLFTSKDIEDEELSALYNSKEGKAGLYDCKTEYAFEMPESELIYAVTREDSPAFLFYGMYSYTDMEDIMEILEEFCAYGFKYNYQRIYVDRLNELEVQYEDSDNGDMVIKSVRYKDVYPVGRDLQWLQANGLFVDPDKMEKATGVRHEFFSSFQALRRSLPEEYQQTAPDFISHGDIRMAVKAHSYSRDGLIALHSLTGEHLLVKLNK